MFFVSHSCNVRSLVTYECRRPEFDVDANQQEVLMLTPSCVAAVDVILNVQALSTRAQRSAHISRSVPFLTCYYYINCVLACVSRALFQVRFFPTSNAHALSYKGTQSFFTTGEYSPNFVSKFTRQIRHGGKLTNSKRSSYHTTVCRSTQTRQRTCVNHFALRDDWIPSQSECSCPLLKPWLLHT